MVDIIGGKPVFEVFVWGSSDAVQLQKYLVYNTHEYPGKKIKLAIK